MIRLLTIAFLLLPAIAFGQVNVRSGEHADFSRLVFDFPNEPAWQFGRGPGGYELRISDGQLDFDFSNVFRYIPKDRIQSIQQGPNGAVLIHVSCNCHADAFILQSGAIVVDVKNGAPSELALFESELPTIEPQIVSASVSRNILANTAVQVPPEESLKVPKVQVITGAQESSETEPISTEIEPEEVNNNQGAPTVSNVKTLRVTEEMNMAAEMPRVQPKRLENAAAKTPKTDAFVADSLTKALDNWKNPRVAETQEDLFRQLGRAASQGMILTDVFTNLEQPVAGNAGGQTVRPDLADDLESQAARESKPHLQVLTVVDRDNPSRFNGQKSTDGGTACLPNDHFDLASWGGQNIATLGGKRALLLEEFDQPNPDAVQALVQQYLFLGFGAEALALMATFKNISDHVPIYKAIAQTLDGLPNADGNVLSGQEVCESDVALWAVLANGKINAHTLGSADAIIAALSRLPEHLQEYIGTRTANIFFAANDPKIATTIRNIIARNSGPFGPEYALLQSRISGDLGKSESVVRELRGALQDSGPQLAPLVVELVQTTLKSGQTIDAETAALAEALAFENRGTPIGAHLAEIAIRGLISSRAYEKAFSSIDVAVQSGDILDVQANEMLAEIHLGNAMTASDMDFLNTLFGHDNSFHKVAGTFNETRLLVTKRLIALGFAKQAKVFFGPMTETKDDRAILAEIELLSGNPERAEILLTDVDVNSSVMLRARVKEALNDPAAAKELYSRATMPDYEKSAAWRAGDWGQIKDAFKDEPSSAKFRAAEHAHADNLKTGVLEPSQEIDKNLPSIARGQVLIEQSETARKILEELLG